MGCKVRREEEWRRQSPVVVILNSVPGLGNEQNHWRMHSHSRLTNRPFSNLGLSSNTNPNEWSIRPPTERIQPWYMALDWSTRLHNLILCIITIDDFSLNIAQGYLFLILHLVWTLKVTISTYEAALIYYSRRRILNGSIACSYGWDWSIMNMMKICLMVRIWTHCWTVP